MNWRHKLADKKTRKSLERGDFRLLHYAGEVTYCVVGKRRHKKTHLRCQYTFNMFSSFHVLYFLWSILFNRVHWQKQWSVVQEHQRCKCTGCTMKDNAGQGGWKENGSYYLHSLVFGPTRFNGSKCVCTHVCFLICAFVCVTNRWCACQRTL